MVNQPAPGSQPTVPTQQKSILRTPVDLPRRPNDYAKREQSISPGSRLQTRATSRSPPPRRVQSGPVAGSVQLAQRRRGKGGSKGSKKGAKGGRRGTLSQQQSNASGKDSGSFGSRNRRSPGMRRITTSPQKRSSTPDRPPGDWTVADARVSQRTETPRLEGGRFSSTRRQNSGRQQRVSWQLQPAHQQKSVVARLRANTRTRAQQDNQARMQERSKQASFLDRRRTGRVPWFLAKRMRNRASSQ